MRITDTQREALRSARDFLKAVADESNDNEYLETGDALDAMETAYNAIDELFTPISDYERRVRDLEAEGMTRSDAQAVADAQDMQQPEPMMLKNQA